MKRYGVTLFLVFLMSSFMLSFPVFSQTTQVEETFTISTYYPSPYGVYKELRAQRMAIGDNYYGSDYCWEGSCTNQINADTDLVVEGRVGIGTVSPLYQLHLKGVRYISPPIPPVGWDWKSSIKISLFSSRRLIKGEIK